MKKKGIYYLLKFPPFLCLQISYDICNILKDSHGNFPYLILS